jgi:hypothetical protein
MDWIPEQVADYVRKYNEFDGMLKDSQFQELIEV